MTRRALACLGALLVLLAADAPGARAFHRDGLPLLAEGGGAGTGWASFSVETDGAPFAVDAMALAVHGSAQTAIYLFDGAGTFLWGVQFTIVHPADDGILLDASPLGEPLVSLDTRTDIGPGGSYLGMGIDIDDAGAYKILVWASGRADAWSWAVHGASGSSVGTSVLSGASSFLYEAGDFRGPLSAQAAHEGAAARVAVEAAKVVAVKDKLYGMFVDVNFKFVCAAVCAAPPAPTVMSAAGPLGDTRDCTALRGSVCRWVGNGPGNYTFRMTGPDAGRSGETRLCAPSPAEAACAYAQVDADYVILGGADARLV